MRSSWWRVLALALGLSACEENEQAVADPEPLAPVEVTVGGAEAPDDPTEDVEALRARVVELEQQLAQCRGDTAPATAPQMAAVPEGVDAPAGGEAAEPPDSTEAGASPSARPRDRDRDPLGLPNPLDILLGD